MKPEEIAALSERLGLKSPQRNTPVHKEECIYSNDTEKSPKGLYINLKTFQSFGHDMLTYDRSGQDTLYLHVKKNFVPRKVPEEEEEATPNVDDRGAAVYKQKKLYDEVLECHVCSSARDDFVPLDMAPQEVQSICKAIVDHEGYDVKKDDFYWEEKAVESKYAKSLFQIDSPPVINYGDLACQRCGAKSNLWLNLSDGYIGCGRKNFDCGGCQDGQEGAAIQHYNETGGVRPLAVKVGTITATSGDVYSYAPDEDCLVIDPYLADHLAHFGIDVKNLTRTEKSTLELEMEKNELHDWSNMNTSDTEVAYGPGLVGMDNLGNTCYMNSAIQFLAAVDDLASYFNSNYDRIARGIPEGFMPHEDVLLQFAKTIKSLITDRVVNQQLELINLYKKACEEASIEYVKPEEYKNFSIRPTMLKYAIGQTKKDFLNNDQQDAEEFLSFFINLLEDMSPEIKRRCAEPLKLKDMFFAYTRQSIICDSLNKITYNDNENQMICLPLYSASCDKDKMDSSEPIPLTECFKNWGMEQEIEYLQGSETHPAVIKNSFLTLPDYLIVNLERFHIKPDYTIEKITNPITVPPEGIVLETCEERDTEGYNIECNTRETKKAKTTINPGVLKSLMAMGFSEKLCTAACEKTGSSDIETCVNWILTNMDNVSEDNLECGKDASDVAVNASILMDLGYSHESASMAAEKFGDDIAAAVDWITNNEGRPKSNKRKRSTYRPTAIISHIGSSINTGHYVCHVNRNGHWYTFNDSKVLRNNSIPTGNGYIYLLRRCPEEPCNIDKDNTEKA